MRYFAVVLCFFGLLSASPATAGMTIVPTEPVCKMEISPDGMLVRYATGSAKECPYLVASSEQAAVPACWDVLWRNNNVSMPSTSTLVYAWEPSEVVYFKTTEFLGVATKATLDATGTIVCQR